MPPLRLIRLEDEVVVEETLGDTANSEVATVVVDGVEHTVEGVILLIVESREVDTVESNRVEHTVAGLDLQLFLFVGLCQEIYRLEQLLQSQKLQLLWQHKQLGAWLPSADHGHVVLAHMVSVEVDFYLLRGENPHLS